MEQDKFITTRQKMIEHIAACEKELGQIANTLKKDFVGLDKIIDQLIQSIKVWYIFPELQIRPTIICLWGLTGVGKTDMIRKMVSYMRMQDRFLEIEMQGENDSYKKIQKRLDTSSIAPEEKCILFLDEFQKFRTVDEAGNVNTVNTAYSDVWTLLSDGKFQADLSRKTELLEQLLYSKYYKDWEDTEKANKKTGDASTPDTTKMQEIQTVTRKYKTPVYLARKVKRLFKVADSIEDIMMWSDQQIMTLYDTCANSPEIYEGDSFKKMLIIIGGNLDEAYRIANEVGEADADADYYHEQSKRLTVIDIKNALRRRFRPEQIARFGNSHILYPSLSRKNYHDIIVRKCQQISDLVGSAHGITITYDESVYKVMYENGVFPTQGVRPLLSTITNILSASLPTFIYRCLLEDLKVCQTSVEKNMMFATIAGQRVEVIIPTVLDNIRLEITDDYKHLVAVHELGHAIAYCLLYNTPPKQICANSTSSYTGGFVIPHTLLAHKEGEQKYLQIYMAGTAAESIVFGSNMISNGAEHDIQTATHKAWAMLGRWGWDKYSSALTQEYKDFRNLVPAGFHDECERLIAEAKKNAVDLLNAHLSIYKKMLPLLLAQGKLKAEDFIRVFKAHNIELIKIEPDENLVVGYNDLSQRFLSSVEPLTKYIEAVHVNGNPVVAKTSPKRVVKN